MNTRLQGTLRIGTYAAVILVILTLTGMFTILEARSIVEGSFTLLGLDIPISINLSNAVFIASMAGTAYLVASRLDDARLVVKAGHGVLATAVMGVALAIVVAIETQVDMTFVFRNLDSLLGSSLLFQQTDFNGGITLMLLAALSLGVIGALLVQMPGRLRAMVLASLGFVTLTGLLQDRLIAIIDLPDALAVLLLFLAGYLVGLFAPLPSLTVRLVVGVLLGVGLGLVMLLAVRADGLEDGSPLHGVGTDPVVLALALPPETVEAEDGTTTTPPDTGWIAFLAVTAAIATTGVLTTAADRQMHDAAWYLGTSLLLLGMLNWQGVMTPLLAVMSLALLMLSLWLVPRLSDDAAARYSTLGQSAPSDDPEQANRRITQEQRLTRLLLYAATLGVMLFTPVFAGQYITSVLDLVMLYIIMGIGLNVMIGYAGLLDLGYVASYAIGAYTAGILTTPSLVTIGCMDPAYADADFMEFCTGVLANWEGTGILTFWEAWPVAVLFSALTGMMLGVPVLRLRGDYLAIVTLGFGEIVNRLLLSNTFQPLLGGAQGISPIPSPVIDLTGLGLDVQETIAGAQEIYYLFLFAVFLAAFVVLQLAGSRLGRAWRAIRADEDVAEAVGIHLVGNKLLAFGISSAFAGLGGAIFGGWLQGIFPNSFTLFVSVNVLSLIIIGGMGSIPGVVLGAFMLIGLPEALREIQDYRLLAFGSLLVVAMLLKPEGLIPPKPPRLSERASTRRQEVTL